MQWQAVVVGLLALLNLTATVTVARSGTFLPAQRRWQWGLIWLLPCVGAVLCFQLAKTDTVETGLRPGQHDPDHFGSDGVLPDYVPTLCGCDGGADGGD